MSTDAEEVFCPATMCPLFASGGSPWTGEVNTPCEREPCGFYRRGSCFGADAAHEQVALAAAGRPVLQLVVIDGLPGLKRKSHAPVAHPRAGTEFDCPRAGECQWQLQAQGLCPPREALRRGVDPRNCAW